MWSGYPHSGVTVAYIMKSWHIRCCPSSFDQCVITLQHDSFISYEFTQSPMCEHHRAQYILYCRASLMAWIPTPKQRQAIIWDSQHNTDRHMYSISYVNIYTTNESKLLQVSHWYNYFAQTNFTFPNRPSAVLTARLRCNAWWQAVVLTNLVIGLPSLSDLVCQRPHRCPSNAPPPGRSWRFLSCLLCPTLLTCLSGVRSKYSLPWHDGAFSVFKCCSCL